MQRVQVTLLVDAPASAVWEVLTDANYIPKLYPDLQTSRSTRPGGRRWGNTGPSTGEPASG
jgi:uncharacterized protein YndB with AHSA1/START domain